MQTKILLALIASIGTTAMAKTYSYKHTIGFMSYPDEAACKADGYRWEDEICLADTEDTVSVTKKGKFYQVVVDTVTTNAHLCSFDAANGKLVGKNKIVSSAPSTKYDYDKGTTSPSTCKVTVIFNKDKSVSVKTNGFAKCQDFCGMNATLEIEKAIEQ